MNDDGPHHMLHRLNAAAAAVLSSSSSHDERANASRFLEEWMNNSNPQVWVQFEMWLRHLLHEEYRSASSTTTTATLIAPPSTTILLLCLQLLQTKARKSLPYADDASESSTTAAAGGDPSSSSHDGRSSSSLLIGIGSTLSDLIILTGNNTAAGLDGASVTVLSSATCTALACLSVRAGWVPDLVRNCVESIQAASAVVTAMTSAVPHQQQTAATTAQHRMPVLSALKILESIPAELEACALPPSRISSTLAPYMATIREAVRVVLMTTAPHGGVDHLRCMGAALKALERWIKIGHVPLSALNAPRPSPSSAHVVTSTEPTLLAVLTRIVSMVPVDVNDDDAACEAVLVETCAALEESIRVPTDACTPERMHALHAMLQVPGFIAAPLHYASSSNSTSTLPASSSMNGDSSWDSNDTVNDGCRWENGSRALASLLCTLVCEHVDDFVTSDGALQSLSSSPWGGDDGGLPSLLIELQQHPLLAVRRIVLDVWLAVQDVPTSERSEPWKKPLFHRLLPLLLSSCRYPMDYDSDGGGWDDVIVTDESEWKEYRRLVSDVLASTYLLLRADFVETCLQGVVSPTSNATDWRTCEAPLYGLTAVARDVCARIKSGAGSGGSGPDATSSVPIQKSLITIDRERTAHSLQVLVQSLCGSAPDDAVASLNRIHARVLEATCDFLGAYSPAWRTLFNSADGPMQLLAFLHRALSVQNDATSAAKSIRSILIACSPVLSAADAAQLVPLIQHLMQASVTIPDDDVLSSVIEGCTRVLVQVQQDAVLSQGLAAMVDPLMRSCGSALEHLQANTATDPSMVAVELLGRSLLGWQVLIQFCDNLPSGGDHSSPHMAGLLNAVWQVLEQASRYVTSRASTSSPLLDRVLSVHEQLLKTVPAQMAPHMEATIEQALNMLEHTKDAASVRYLARAVEVYGASNTASFRSVLERVSSAVSAAVVSEPNSAELLASFFDLCHRYVLYCPAALVESPQFASIARFAADSTTSSECGRDCIRAAFHLLGQLFGYRTLVAIPATSRKFLDAAASRIDELLHALGGTVASRCVHALAGGGSQMLWPPAVDCLYAVLSSGPAALATPDGSTVGRQWLEHSRPSTTDEVLFRQVSSLLFEVLADGPTKGRTKVRMLLTDFGKIQAGEASADCLITYSYS